MKVTWEVQRKFFKWKTVYTCTGSMPLEVRRSAEEVMFARSKGFGKLFKWRLRGS